MSVALERDERKASKQADLELMRAVEGGDGTAYRGLVEKYQGRVYQLVYGMVRNQEDARDITQEAFVKAFKGMKDFRRESGFYTWIYRIAMNLAIDFTRKHARRESEEFDEALATRGEDGTIADIHHEESPARQLERRELYTRIMDAMQHLPDDQRQVLLLRELEGLQYREISEIMGVPEGTVMSRLFYARKKLQKLLTADESPSTE
jgi:RNA polymerase sigma-70 factor, ECF subfamily